MKLRCIQNSIRIRVKKSDVQQLLKDKKISSSVSFGINSFSFSLSIEDVPELIALFEKNEMKVYLPEVKAMVWANSNQVGMEQTLTLNENISKGLNGSILDGASSDMININCTKMKKL